jgi:hypothetical protein
MKILEDELEKNLKFELETASPRHEKTYGHVGTGCSNLFWIAEIFS